MELNDSKAGMNGLNKEEISAKITDWSKGSNFYDYQMKRKARLNARVELLQRRFGQFTPEQIFAAEKKMDAIALSLESERYLSGIFCHVDMDAFFAAVEMRDDPKLRHIPMAVGSNLMLSTSNYMSRAFGVRSGMPGFIAKKLCPNLLIVPCNFEKYRSVSRIIRHILLEYDPNLSMGSLDEAYMNITEYINTRQMEQINSKQYSRVFYTGSCVCKAPHIPTPSLHSCCQLQHSKTIDSCSVCTLEQIEMTDSVSFGHTPDEVGKEIRFRVLQETGLTCSIGIAANPMLSKICSDINKPNGQFLLVNDREAILKFVREMAIRKVCGIGPVTESLLKGLGICTGRDMYEKRAMLSLLFSERMAVHFLSISLGIDRWTPDKYEDGTRKSISVERTFTNTSSPKELYAICRHLCAELSEIAKRRCLKGRTISVKLKTIAFDVMTRAHTVKHYTNDCDVMYETAAALLENEMRRAQSEPLCLRLMGVRLSSLQNDSKRDLTSDTVTMEHFAIVDRTSQPDTVAKCPICCQVLNNGDLQAINQHVDICLNLNAIDDLQSSDCALKKRKTSIRETSSEPKRQIDSTLLRYFPKLP